jgi:hypothetical protein
MRPHQKAFVFFAAIAAAIYIATKTDIIPPSHNPLSVINLDDPPNLMTGTKLWLMEGNTGACLAALQRSDATFKIAPVHTESFQPSCELFDTVIVSKFSRARIEPEEMRCDVALRLYLLERHDIQPLARRHFGKDVAELMDFGSYSCRNIAGSRHLSEHATANAYDLAGFKLANGRTITLKQGWNGDAASRTFLRDLRIRSCLLFNMVLSPDSNADHADHFHFDMGLWRGCN